MESIVGIVSLYFIKTVDSRQGERIRIYIFFFFLSEAFPYIFSQTIILKQIDSIV